MAYNYCIVGAGITGLGLLLLLQEAKVDLSKVCIIDPHFDGGELARRWTSVESNTPWSKTRDALAAVCPSLPLFSLPPHPADRTTPLVEIAHALRCLAQPALAQVGLQVQGEATQAEYSSSTRKWSIRVTVAGKEEVIDASQLVLAVGAEPRSLNLPIPSIPLEIALDPRRLSHFVRPGQRVLTVGTMHSGTLVARAVANDCSASCVSLYNTPTPFVWDRDGAYDGIKAEAAEIADRLVAQKEEWTRRVRLIPVTDTSGVLRAGREADWVIYAMGFSARQSIRLSVDGKNCPSTAYDGTTGALTEAPSAWGFGTAYPNRAPDGVHWDVSVAAFLSHMKQQLPLLLSNSES